jgi:fatty-acyl-CoA synthase
MLGLMQDYPLLTHTILEHGALNHGEREMVTRAIEGPIRRTTLGRVREGAAVARRWSRTVKQGDRIATMAWNTGACRGQFGIMGIRAIATPESAPVRRAADYVINHAERHRLRRPDLRADPEALQAVCARASTSS